MITTSHFTIGHIAKTGGDAVKQILAAVFEAGLEHNFHIDTVFGGFKHRPFTGNENFRVLGIRRLPSMILSMAQHDHNLGGRSLWTPEQCASMSHGDVSLAHMTHNHTMQIHMWLRCEHLREDIKELLKRFYGEAFTKRFAGIVDNTPTKNKMKYDHDVTHFFSKDQIRQLYLNNPVWAEREIKLYGNTLE